MGIHLHIHYISSSTSDLLRERIHGTSRLLTIGTILDRLTYVACKVVAINTIYSVSFDRPVIVRFGGSHESCMDTS
jgi:hypothetical protein